MSLNTSVMAEDEKDNSSLISPKTSPAVFPESFEVNQNTDDPSPDTQSHDADNNSLSSSSILSLDNEVQAYHADSQIPFILKTNTATGPTDGASRTQSLPGVPSRPERRSRASTFTSWFQRSNGVENGNIADGGIPGRTSSRMSHRLTLDRDATAFIADATLPSVMLETNEDLISMLMDSDSDTEKGVPDLGLTADDDDSTEIAKHNIRRTSTLTSGLGSLKRQVTNSAKDTLKKIGFFDPSFEKVKLYLTFVRGYILLISAFMAIFSLYWGSMYKREDKLINMKVMVVLDNPEIYSTLNIDDYFSNTLKLAIQDPSISPLAGWEPILYTDITNDTSGLRDLLMEKVYHQKTWGCVYVKPNATLDYYSSLVGSSGTFDLSSSIEVIYETGREYIAISSYLAKSFQKLQAKFLSLQIANLTAPIVEQLTDLEIKENLEILSTPVQFTTTDLTDSKLIKSIVSGPQQFGLVYLHLLSLMQFVFFLPFHLKMATKLTDKSFIIYRVCSSQITYLLMALAYTLVQVAFGINIYEAYNGKVGFLVFWIFTYLLLSALGGINENVVLFIQSTFPNLTPLWMLFYMIVNIAPTYYPMALSPKFYRYGYALPIKNGFELYKIVLFDTYKKANIVRNILVLLAWSISMYTLLPFTMRYYSKRMSEKNKKKLRLLKKLKRARHNKKLRKRLGLSAEPMKETKVPGTEAKEDLTAGKME